MKLLADKGIWLNLQAIDEAPPKQLKKFVKKHKVLQGTANAFTCAKKHNTIVVLMKIKY